MAFVFLSPPINGQHFSRCKQWKEKEPLLKICFSKIKQLFQRYDWNEGINNSELKSMKGQLWYEVLVARRKSLLINNFDVHDFRRYFWKLSQYELLVNIMKVGVRKFTLHLSTNVLCSWDFQLEIEVED